LDLFLLHIFYPEGVEFCNFLSVFEKRLNYCQGMIIHSWATPRSLSTAMMYSFAQRNDTEVVDELLYPSYLDSNPDVKRSYREKLLTEMNDDLDANTALDRLNKRNDSDSNKITYVKHISKFYDPKLDPKLLFGPNKKHIIMMRDPATVVSSWSAKENVHGSSAEWEDVGFHLLLQIYRDIKRYSGQVPIIVDTELLRKHPKEILTELCLKLDIPFDENMLQWEAGPKAYDGLWANEWYTSVHKSTGFEFTSSAPPLPSRRSDLIVAADGSPFDNAQIELLNDMMPFYSQLRKSAIGVHPLNPGCSVSPGRLLYLPETAKATGKSNDGYKLDPKALTDARNANLLAFVGDQLVPRDHAKVSVFDGAVQGGDGCWEGMRVYNGRVFRMKEHIDRLFDSARALGFGCMSGDGGSDLVPTRDYIESAIRKTMAANGMLDDAHMRVTLTRGPKVTSSMNPIFNTFGCCLIVLPEWKAVCSATTYDNSKGISLITATNRRNPPACVDSKIHHNNMINNILPKIQANLAGAADSVMLDMEGMVAETNATNMFL
jgi:protein-lysine N-methyltransferase EEF2KMT